MAKPLPLQYGRFYHIYNRGNNRENVFVDEVLDWFGGRDGFVRAHPADLANREDMPGLPLEWDVD